MITQTNPLSYSGACAQAIGLSRSLKHRGMHCMFLAPSTKVGVPQKVKNEVEIHYIWCLNLKYIDIMLHFILFPLMLIKLRKKYDIVHIHGPFRQCAAIVLTCKLLQKKSLIKMTMAGADDPLSLRRISAFFLRLEILSYIALKACDAVISTSSQLACLYGKSSLPNRKLREIPNGVDTNLFKPPEALEKNVLRAKLGFSKESIIVCFNGALIFRKGIDVLFEAWLKIWKQYPNLQLVLVGPIVPHYDGSDSFVRQFLDNFNKDNSHNRIIHTGFIDREQVVQYLQISDFFVLPSRKEGLPNSLLEAMSCGLLCIASDIGGNTDIIEHKKNGLVFSLEHTDSLATILSEAIANRDTMQHLPREARKTILAKYSLEKVAQSYVDLYHHLLKHG